MVKTRAGVMPVENEIPYSITTEEVEQFLQKKFNSLAELARKNGTDAENIKVMLFTSDCGKKLKPFIVLLPTSVLASKKDKGNNQELSMFNPDSSEKSVRLKQWVYELLNCYQYDKTDKQLFFNQAWRRQVGISMHTAHILKANCFPHIQKFNKGRIKYVTCLLDPVRIFHDMLGDVENPKAQFDTWIGKTEKIRLTSYRYDVYRTVKGKHNKEDKPYQDILARELNHRINGND